MNVVFVYDLPRRYRAQGSGVREGREPVDAHPYEDGFVGRPLGDRRREIQLLGHVLSRPRLSELHETRSALGTGLARTRSDSMTPATSQLGETIWACLQFDV